MEWCMGAGQVRALSRSLHCVAKVSQNDYVTLDAYPDKWVLRTLNTSKTAYLAITFAGAFFDRYTFRGAFAHARPSQQGSGSSGDGTVSVTCSILVKSALAVFRTPVSSIESLSLRSEGSLDSDPERLCWMLYSTDGVRKTYWTPCVTDHDVLAAAVDPGAYPSLIVVRPRELMHLLGNFQATLAEMTLIATRPQETQTASRGQGSDEAPETRAVELRSYVDPAVSGSSLSGGSESGTMNTQLWIDPVDEFVEYHHSGDPVDVTFSLRELKAFVAFCEVSEADVCVHFHKAGTPALFVPRFNTLAATSDLDASMLVATLLTSQLGDGGPSAPSAEVAATATAAAAAAGLAKESGERGAASVPRGTPGGQGTCAGSDREGSRSDAGQSGGDSGAGGKSAEGGTSTHTRVWSDLSGSRGREARAGGRFQVGAAGLPDSGHGSEDLLLQNRTASTPAGPSGGSAEKQQRVWRDPNQWIDSMEDEGLAGQLGAEEAGIGDVGEGDEGEEFVPATPQEKRPRTEA